MKLQNLKHNKNHIVFILHLKIKVVNILSLNSLDKNFVSFLTEYQVFSKNTVLRSDLIMRVLMSFLMHELLKGRHT